MMAVYELAYHLRIPIYELAENMTFEEFDGWMAYLERRPVDWRDDLRTYMLMKLEGVKEQPAVIFSSLAPIFKPDKPNPDGSISGKSLRSSPIFGLLKSAKFGDSPDFLFKGTTDETKDGA